MKTLILCATKYGAAYEIAQRIAKNIDSAVIHDLKKGGAPSLEDFDCIIIGSSLYVGSIRMEAKEFFAHNSNSLQKKKVGLFLSGMDGSGEKKYFEGNFPADILRAAKAVDFLGGIYDPKKVGMVGRFLVKIAAKQTEYINTINDEKIRQFAGALKI